MRRRTLAAFAFTSAVSLSAAIPTEPGSQEGPFQLACPTLPFETIKKERPIDEDCDVAGNATQTNHQAQNRAKNNFCASGGPALTTFLTFSQLQAKGEAALKPLGTHMPNDRALLQDLHTTSEGDVIGEGDVVFLVGFLVRGKYSNLGSGESVNCDLGDKEENDIHLNLVKNKPPVEPTDAQLKTLECQSVVAEISPHFRPEAWEAMGNLTKTSANATAAKKIAALDLRRPVRFTGQLFYDGSHPKPCVSGEPQGGTSRRMSAWEIHPIYAIDVCINTSLSGCPVDQPNKWKPLHEWLAQLPDGD